MKPHVLVAAAGEDMDTSFQVMRAIPVEKMVMITSEKDRKAVKEFEKDLHRFRVPVQIVGVRDYSINEMFGILKRVKEAEKGKDIIMNVASGSKLTSCVTLSAAFVNGIKAVGVMGDEMVSFPIMKFSYYKALSDQKLRILQHLHDNTECCASLEELSRRVKMSLPLISYHMNGNQKVEGLEKMGLVELVGKGKRISVRMSSLGKMLMAGYL